MSDSDYVPDSDFSDASDVDSDFSDASDVELEPEELELEPENVVVGPRQRTQTKFYHDESYVAGANNKHTAGREVDPYDRKF